MSQLVYFIQAAESGRVKIGIAANPVRRLAELQTGSPEPLRILGVIPGGARLESQLHARFADDRLHGEWFRPSLAVLDYLGVALGWNTPTPDQEASARKATELRELLGVT